ncbi:MAG: signal peptidase I [Sphingomonadales bacterium]|nr:signal peptidase I [Sphingomonadales bacterium]
MDTTPSTAVEADNAPVAQSEEWGDFFAFLVKFIIAVAIIRILVFSTSNIPSESMQPRLLIGDYVVVNRWAYGWSRYSLPLGRGSLPEGRVWGAMPQRGDVVVFKAPPANDVDWIKRVIGLPGDRIQVIGGILHINGTAVPRRQIADLVIPASQNMIDASDGNPCFRPIFEQVRPDGGLNCRYPRFRETLPGGRQANVLDLITGDADNTGVYEVPEGHLFLMGDNRDRSYDSRFPAVDGGGIGYVPVDNIIGRASFVVMSVDGSARWSSPASWFNAIRWSRLGYGF